MFLPISGSRTMRVLTSMASWLVGSCIRSSSASADPGLFQALQLRQCAGQLEITGGPSRWYVSPTDRLAERSQEKRMDLHLGGKIVVVTGASKGIGWAITRALVDEGATVVAGARSSGPDLLALENQGRVIFVPVDLTTPAGPIELVARAAALGGVDVLINNAGAVSPRPGGFASVTDEDW